MGTSLLNVAVTGLNAAQSGLLTTSHNISNASTAGFNRQRIIQTTQIPQFSGSGFVGQGTRVETVERAYSNFLFTQVKASQANTSYLESYVNQIDLINNMLGDTTVGLSPAVTNFFAGVNAVVAAPSSIPSRQSLLTSAQSVVSRFQDLSSRLNQIFDGTNTQIRSEVDAINSLALQVSEVNKRISLAEAAGPTQKANDLRDQRDQLVMELSKHIRTDVLVQSDGSFSVFFGNGQPLVVGESVYTMGVKPNTSDATRLMVSLVTPLGTSSEIPESLVSGGALGGLLEFRSKTLDVAQNTLGRLALGLASAFNDQHKLGQDLLGNVGGDFFKLPTPMVTPDTGNGTPTTQPGSVAARVTDVGALTTSDYILTYTASSGYSLRRVEDDQVILTGAALPATADGLTFTVSGVPADGASFRIQATRYAARDLSLAITDPRSIAAGLPVAASVGTKNVGTATISQGSLATPVTLTYSTASAGFTGFPEGSSVSLWDTATNALVSGSPVTITSVDQSVSIPAGTYATVNGITFRFTATPANGDSFIVGPGRLEEGAANTGTADIAAAAHMRTAFTYTLASNSLSLSSVPDPLLNTIVTVNNSGTITEYPIRLGNETIPYVSGATYTINGVSVVLSGVPTGNGSVIVGNGYTDTMTETVAGMTLATVPASGFVPSSGLPTANYTLTYDNANNRLVGFPAGTTVAVTVNGTTSQVQITSPDQGITYTDGMQVTVNGVVVKFGGTPGDGDTFKIGPTASSTTDNRNALALASVQTQKVLLSGTASIESAYAQFVSTIGNKGRELDATFAAQSELLTQAQNAVQGYSGVNLDEEAANLLRYQQAYQAAAKIIDISSKLFDLLATLG